MKKNKNLKKKIELLTLDNKKLQVTLAVKERD